MNRVVLVRKPLLVLVVLAGESLLLRVILLDVKREDIVFSVEKNSTSSTDRSLLALCIVCVVDSLSTTVTFRQFLRGHHEMGISIIDVEFGRRSLTWIVSRSGDYYVPVMACLGCNRMHNFSRSFINLIASETVKRIRQRHFASRYSVCITIGQFDENLARSSRTQLIGDSIDMQDLRKKLFVDHNLGALVEVSGHRPHVGL